MYGSPTPEDGRVKGARLVAIPVLVTLTDCTGPRIIYLCAMLASALGALGFSWFAGGFWTAPPGPAALLVLDRGRRPSSAPAKARRSSN